MSLNYDVKTIKLSKVTELHALLDQVDAVIAETDSEKLKVEQKIIDLKEASKPKQGYFSKLEEVFAKVKEVDTTASEIEEQQKALVYLDQYLLDQTGKLLSESEDLAEQVVKEAREFYEPYRQELSVKNADATDAVGMTINQLVIDAVVRHNSLLSETKWVNFLSLVQPKYQGRELKQIDLGLAGIAQLYGTRIKELVGGL